MKGHCLLVKSNISKDEFVYGCMQDEELVKRLSGDNEDNVEEEKESNY